MLTDFVKEVKPDHDELEQRLAEARNKLFVQQMALKEKKLPVLVLFEGWGAAGKGSVLGKVIKNIDPRFFKVATMDRPTEEELRKPFLYRHFVRIPQEGKFVFYNGGWMEEVTNAVLHGELAEEDYKKRIDSVRRFERQLTDNGYLVMKFFFHIGKKQQKKRLDELMSDKSTKWRVEEFDLWQNEHYDECMDVYEKYLNDTNQSASPWYIIHSKEKKWAQLQLLETLVSGIDTALANSALAVPVLQNVFPLVKAPRLSEITLNQELTEEEYRSELKKCQKRLRELHNEIYRKKIPVILAYEGFDAAGKGGNIKRITGALDPRGFEVHPIASPEPHEKARHYLWRFWNRLPKDGHVAIFDRTWYGRVMVERLEGFCSENDWKRAYNEINEFEKELSDWGAIVIKFWVHIDKDTQLERFTDRQNTPAKQWKITDEDWRNRDKWELYESAVDEMIAKTNTPYAPWVVLESNDKKYARIKALKTVIAEIEKRLK